MTTVERKRLIAGINRLSLRPIMTMRAEIGDRCCFCTQPIMVGEQNRSAGRGLRSHEYCFRAVADSLKSDR